MLISSEIAFSGGAERLIVLKFEKNSTAAHQEALLMGSARCRRNPHDRHR
jgi:hypothetical protein